MTEQPFLRIERLSKRFGAFTALKDDRSRGPARRVRVLPRAVRLRQDHAPARDRRPRPAGRGPDRDRRPRRVARPAGRPRLRHRVPVLRPVPEPHRRPERRLRPRQPPQGRSRDQAPRRRAPGARRPARAGPQISDRSSRAASSSASRSPARSRPRPSLLLLDEPLSALDAKVRVRLRDEIRALQQRLGVTTIMVTHDQEEALDHGRPHRGDEPRRHRAGRHADRDLPRAGRPPSSPISSAP